MCDMRQPVAVGTMDVVPPAGTTDSDCAGPGGSLAFAMVGRGGTGVAGTALARGDTLRRKRALGDGAFGV